MNTAPVEITNALVDVRNAYRLLHDYQRAALDTVKYVAHRLGFTYTDGCPNFGDSITRTQSADLLDRPSWDWLNLVFYDFTFTLTREQRAKKPTKLAIWLLSDTGYFLAQDTADKTDVSSFVPAGVSGTKLAFFFFRDWPETLDDFCNDRAAVRRFLESGRVLPKKFAQNKVVGRCYDFARVGDDQSTEEVIAELAKFAVKYGYPVERLERPLIEQPEDGAAPSWIREKFIPNKALKTSNIPSGLRGWMEFALTFDGYKAHGSLEACAAIANRKSPQTLTEYRTCLFFEQRRWHHWGTSPSKAAKPYILSLLAGIRDKVEQGEIA